MPKIIKPNWPLLVARNDETRLGRRSQPLGYVDRELAGTLSRGLAQDSLDDLDPGALSADSLDKLRYRKIAALHSAAEQHPGPSIRVDHVSDRLTSHSAWLLAAAHGQGNIELVPARHVAASEIGDRPCEGLNV